MQHPSVNACEAQRVARVCRRTRGRVLRALCAAGALWPAVLSAQAAPPFEPRPQEWTWQAMRAQVIDSIPLREQEWRAAAAAAPTAVEPRFGLSVLARVAERYDEAEAWLDSARRLAVTPRWRNAVARERIMSLLRRDEKLKLPAMVDSLAADSALIPREDWAHALWLGVAVRRRLSLRTTVEELDAVMRFAAPDDAILRSRVECMRAVVDAPRMLEHAVEAIRIARSIGAHGTAGSCELVLGVQYSTRSDLVASQAWLQRAESTSVHAHDEGTRAQAIYWQAANLVSMGYVPWALERLATTMRLAQAAQNRAMEGWALLLIANASRQVGDYAVASAAARRSRILLEASGDLGGVAAQSLQEAAAQLQLGNLAGAETLARRSMQLSDSLEALGGTSVNAQRLLADVAARQGRLDDAERLLDSATARMAARGVAKPLGLIEARGLLALKRGQAAVAERLLTEALDGFIAVQDSWRHNLLASLALARLRQGDTTQAAHHLSEANDALDRLRDSVARDGQRRVVQQVDRWGGSAGNGDAVLAALVRSPRWLPTAFALAERTRARALAKGSFGIYAADTSVAVREARARVMATATSLPAVQRALRPNTALLVYSGGTQNAPTSMMLVTRRMARGQALAPLDSLNRDVVRWLALLEAGSAGTGAGRRVSAGILGDALRALPASVTHLVVVPQGPLYRVPFGALPMGTGVVGDRLVVTVSPSVSLALRHAADPMIAVPRVLALGAGDTPTPRATPGSLDLNTERSTDGEPLPPLTAAPDEARAAAAWSMGSLALTGSAASEAAFKREAAGSYTVLHAAAHAVTSDQALGANWLVLRADSVEDGYVSGGELAALNVGRAMVVLSGCRTTGDFGSRGDAIDGLVAPLLARGVRTVVASHWAVSDRMTRVLMERFYGQLGQGAHASEAMHAAQASLRRAGVPARFWAAFSVIGDGDLSFRRATTTPVTGR